MKEEILTHRIRNRTRTSREKRDGGLLLFRVEGASVDRYESFAPEVNFY